MVGETSKKLAHFLLVTTVLMMMMMIFSPHTTTRWGAAASSIQLDNGTLTSLDYQGHMEEPELLFDSEISRMLASYRAVTRGTTSPGKPVVPSCGGRSKQYITCLPRGDNSQQGCKRRGNYQRGCK